MEQGEKGLADASPGLDGLLEQGRAVLRALGERGLAREFDRRAREASDREALAELLLEFLLRRRVR